MKDMRSKILNMNKPLISCYTSYGALSSITADEIYPWISNNFIQIRYVYGWGIFVFDNHNLLLSNCPYISYYDISQDMFKHVYNCSLHDVIIDAIKNDYYLFIYVDRYYLPNLYNNSKKHFEHELMIYGYDEYKKNVYVADNLPNGKFSKCECTFSELQSAYENINEKFDFFTSLRFLKPKKSECSINLEQIIDGLERYLYSKKSFDLNSIGKCEFGIASIELIYTFIKESKERKHKLDIRPFHFLYEHKILAEIRVLSLIKNGYLINEENLLGEFQSLKIEYLTLRNLVLKYNVSNKEDLLTSITNKLKENVNIEKLLFEKLLNILKQ